MLMTADASSLLIVDVQEKLCPVMDDPRVLLHNGRRLMRGAGEPAMARRAATAPPNRWRCWCATARRCSRAASASGRAFGCAGTTPAARFRHSASIADTGR